MYLYSIRHHFKEGQELVQCRVWKDEGNEVIFQ